MQTARIKCPKCHEQMEVKNTLGEEQKTVSCPGCGVQLIVKFKPTAPKTPKPGQTDYGAGNEAGTIVLPPASNTVGALLYNNVTYPLQVGVNTVGRKATNGTASIQIPTPDRTMSRAHSIIEVMPYGKNNVRTVIRNANNMNKTYVAGQLLHIADRIVLNNGDVIRMGRVELTFIAKEE